ncbi:nicotinate-nucleotide--dimethylbenzimidazole phosphoribosyltransferase [Streptomyces resistomycificus]|uniref:nicotinate-nucleotide--dimethylbenzimidazole phosphoribosyltransferase n=1 Tax=Streptomyces resistomycificus TaxID=67356 RepID=UPI000B32011A|nr:nicotinate-nucleotide--dimethylbenzimidazole phosphoribosyltransferase [Streptomyces resistomycificus]
MYKRQALGDPSDAAAAEARSGVVPQPAEVQSAGIEQVPDGQAAGFAQMPDSGFVQLPDAGEGVGFAEAPGTEDVAVAPVPDGQGGELAQEPSGQDAGGHGVPDAEVQEGEYAAQAPQGGDAPAGEAVPGGDVAQVPRATPAPEAGQVPVTVPAAGEEHTPDAVVEAAAAVDAEHVAAEEVPAEGAELVGEVTPEQGADSLVDPGQPGVDAAQVPAAEVPADTEPAPQAAPVQEAAPAPAPAAEPVPMPEHALPVEADPVAETDLAAETDVAAEADPAAEAAPVAEALPVAEPATPEIPTAPDAVDPDAVDPDAVDPDAVDPELVQAPQPAPAPQPDPVPEATAPQPAPAEPAPDFEAAAEQPAAEPETIGADTLSAPAPTPETVAQEAVPLPEAPAQHAVQPPAADGAEHLQIVPEAVPFPDAAQAPQPVDVSAGAAPVEEAPVAMTPEQSPQHGEADPTAPEQCLPPLADAQPGQDAQGPQLVTDASLAQEGVADAAATLIPADAPASAPAAPDDSADATAPHPSGAELPEAQARFVAADAPAGPLPQPHADQPLGQFVPVEGSVPTTPHLAPAPAQALTLPPEALEAPEAAEPVAAVPTPREGDPELVQHAEDLDTRAADQEDPQDPQNPQDPQDQEEMSTAPVEDVRQSTGPAAPAYDDAEREAVLKVMRERRDIRNGFRSDPIPHEVLLRVLEAAHTAPSVGHSQPWDFVVIRSAETRGSMHELAMRQRDAYAKSLPKGRAKQFKELKIEAILDTPVNIVVTADPTRGGRHTLGRHTQPQMAPYSAALAVENLWLAARAEGLGVGWVSFFDEREMVRALGLPEHLEVIAYLCVGYVDEFPDEPELMQAGWSKRRPLSWVVHEETYGRRALPGEEPHDLLGETVAQIRPLDAKALGEAWERQKRMTKPAGALGMLEIISAQLSGLSRQCPPPIPEPAAVAIFAGDHGVHAQGVTPWPQEVTAQMVANFLGGGAVCNAFAAQVGAEVCVVDVGVAADLPATPGLLPRKVRAGTSDMTTGSAMTREEAKQAIEVGIETARDLVAAGNKALLTGEMGIANTTASAALISVFTDADPAEVTGRGTGINDETLARKTEVVRRALELHQPDPADPIGVLAAIGGFEHAAIVGLLLGGASLRTPVILDGVSAGAAALVARAIAPEVLAACIAGHRSAEPGHVAALNKLGLRPLVDLDLRLGEGTGALLALPLVQSTARAMHEVATFDSAGVTEK